MGLLRAIAASFLTFWSLASSVGAQSCTASTENPQSCSWEKEMNSKRYSFDLGASMKGFPHGLRSEDGFYKVSQMDADSGSETTYWFQLCEHMKFNHDSPLCDDCEACGGPEHCGETCSALQAVKFPGYSVCATLGYPGSTSYSFIDPEKPEQGLLVNMSSCNQKSNCSLAIRVFCDRKGEELPTSVAKEPYGSCDFTSSLKHPAGCPVVTSIKSGGMGWFGTLIIMLVCGFTVYLAVGIAYRVTVLGVSGLEAIPNLDFWRALPSNLKSCFAPRDFRSLEYMLRVMAQHWWPLPACTTALAYIFPEEESGESEV